MFNYILQGIGIGIGIGLIVIIYLLIFQIYSRKMNNDYYKDLKKLLKQYENIPGRVEIINPEKPDGMEYGKDEGKFKL